MKNFVISENLAPEAKAYMEDVLQMLDEKGMLEEVDGAALSFLAQNYSTFIKANKVIEENGLTFTSDRGNVAEHPAVKIARDAQTQAMKVMAEFGLTAKSRSKLKQIEDVEDEESPLESFIKGNQG